MKAPEKVQTMVFKELQHEDTNENQCSSKVGDPAVLGEGPGESSDYGVYRGAT